MVKKNPHAVALGRKGGKARLTTMTIEQRREIARNAVKARWAKYRESYPLRKRLSAIRATIAKTDRHAQVKVARLQAEIARLKKEIKP